MVVEESKAFYFALTIYRHLSERLEVGYVMSGNPKEQILVPFARNLQISHRSRLQTTMDVTERYKMKSLTKGKYGKALLKKWYW